MALYLTISFDIKELVLRKGLIRLLRNLRASPLCAALPIFASLRRTLLRVLAPF